jgi:hypothetical protein
VQVFYKKDARSVNEVFRTLPAEYLANFSDRWRSAIWDEKQKLITITGGDKAEYEKIFDWIMESAGQDTVGAAPVPEVRLHFSSSRIHTDAYSVRRLDSWCLPALRIADHGLYRPRHSRQGLC